jgi:hypothetical protein
MAIAGDLKDMSLPSIVQIICMEQRKVELVLNRRHVEGKIFFDDGEIVHARVGPLEGQEAVYHLLTWSNGDFHTTHNVSIPRRTVAVPWNKLLMDGMQKLDELKNVAIPSEPLRRAASDRVDVERDSAAENEMILLLSKLEHVASRLAEKNVRRRPVAALQILTEMVNELAEFSEGVLGKSKSSEVSRKVLNEAEADCPSLRGFQPQNNRLPNDMAATLYNDASSGARSQVFAALCESMISIMDAYFALFTSSLQSETVIARLSEVCRHFLTDLLRMIEGVHA